jgi:tryptophan 2,3-dioxygenase
VVASDDESDGRSNDKADDLPPALKRLARVKHIQNQLTDQWTVLETSSGFQSWQYRAVEFILGNKSPAMLPVFDHDPMAQEQLSDLLHEPSLHDEFLRLLDRAGQLPVLALPPPQDRRAHHRHQARHGWLQRSSLPAQGP